MRNNFKKIALSVILASTIITSSSNVLGEKLTVNLPYTISERKTVDHISSGVVHENIQEFTHAGWWNINVLRIDLKDQHTKIKALLNPKGIPYTSRVTAMVENQNAVAGINGDFFNYKPLPSAMGTLISEGEMISSPIERAYANPSFYINKDNLGKVGYIDRRILVNNYDLKETLFVNTLNKVTPNFDTTTILNKYWGEKSIGNRFHKDLIEVLVKDDLVQEVRTGGEAFIIPENGYVIAGRGPMADALNRFEAGQKVELNISSLFDPVDSHLENIDFAIGGGGIILENGEIVLKNINVKGKHPRTGLGINEDSTELILVTIDGRDSSFKGVSQEVFGALMRRLGAHNAINLDGGGSTSMAIKALGEDKSKLVNKPSDNAERSVVNGVGVFSNAPKGKLSYLKLSAEDDKLFENTRRNIGVKAFDEYHNPIEIDQSQIKFTVEGVEGIFEENTFIPKSSGNAIIKALVNDKEGSLNLQVLNSPQHIYADVDKIYLEKEDKYKLPNIYGKDELGRQARIYLQDIDLEVRGDIGYVKDGYFFSGGQDEGGAISLKFGQGVKNILISKGLKEEFVHGFESIGDYGFSSWPKIVPGELALSEDFKEGKASVSLKYDFTEGENTRAAYINLYPEASGLKLKDFPNKIGLWVKGDNKGAWLRGNILDASKKEHTIDFAKTIDWEGWKYLEAKLPSDISYPIALNRIYVAEVDNAKRYKGEILVDSLSAYYPNFNKNLDLPKDTAFKDSLNKEMAIEGTGFRFVVGNEPMGIETFMENSPLGQMQNQINKSKISVFLNGASETFRSGLTNSIILNGSKGYSINKHYDTAFIALNSSKDGIRSKDANQWISLIDDLENRPETNIIVTLPSPLFGENGFVDSLEADLFHETMVKAKAKDKNIFVIHGDNKNYSDIKDGVRYMGINTSKLTSQADLYKQTMIEFVVNGPDISYKIISPFSK